MSLMNYIRLARLDKPIGIFLLLWPTLTALYIAANGSPQPMMVFIFVVGTIVMRSAGCVLNDWVDKDFDKWVLRTKERPLATGVLSAKMVWPLLAFFLFIAFVDVLFLNYQTILLALLSLGFAILYPWMKRYTYWPQLVLGMAFSMGVLMSFMAVQKLLPTACWLLYVASVIWALIYDTEYAMADRDDDKRLNLRSTAILFGSYDKLIIAFLQIVFVFILYLLGESLGFGYYYVFGLFLVLGCFVYQQYLINQKTSFYYIKAFLNNHYVGMTVFVSVLLEYSLKNNG